MRLTNPRFTYLKFIQQTLFNAIDFIPGTLHFKRLTQSSIRRIAPFVKTVNFVAPLHSWALPFDDFKEIIITQAIQKHRYDHGLLNVEQSHQDFIQQHWSGKNALSDTEIQRGYKNYCSEALAVKELLSGETLPEAWANTFRELFNLQGVRFISIDIEKTGGEHLPAQPACIVHPHHHVNPHHYHHVCWRAVVPVGDALFAAGISCLSRARSQIRSLEVACAMTGSLNWECLPYWKDLDLSRLKNFDMLPLYHYYPHGREPHTAEEVAQSAASAVDAVLQKCNHTLEAFSHKSDYLMKWPSDEIIRLPSLRSLSLGRGPVEAHNLRAWMAEMPSLEHFELQRTTLFEVNSVPECYRWRQVFDGIREHKNDMYVCFLEVEVNCDSFLSLEYDTSDLEGYLEELEARDYGWEIIEKDLPSYLSGEIEWNNDLEEYLQEYYW